MTIFNTSTYVDLFKGSWRPILLGALLTFVLTSGAYAQAWAPCENYRSNACNVAATCKGSPGTTCTSSNGLGNTPTVWYLNGSYWTTVYTNGGSNIGDALAIGPLDEDYKVLADGNGCWNPNSTNPLGPVYENTAFGTGEWVYTWGFSYSCN